MSETVERDDALLERKKRRKEGLLIFLVAVLFLFLTWIEIRLLAFSQTLRYEHSIFFFGLVNFNIILFLLLFFLIFRNVVKIFSERPRGPLGSSLKSKLIVAFVGFSFVPTALMFIVSVFYINNSFDKWFSEKMAGVLKSSLEVTDAYYKTARKRNFHFATRIAGEVRTQKGVQLQQSIDRLRTLYSLDAVEYYPGLFGKRLVSVARAEAVPVIPAVSLEFLQKGLVQKAEATTTHHFAGGDLVRVIVPIEGKGQKAAIVVSSFVPLSLINRMDDIASAYEEFRETNPLEYPVKSIYLIILTLMALVILLGGTWFGFYLAKQMSVPIEALGLASQKIAKGEYEKVAVNAGSAELNQLIDNFNSMTDSLAKSEAEIRTVNQNLQKTLSQLDDHTRYMQVVVSNVSTGVVSVDQAGVITMMNRHAAKLLEIDANLVVGRRAKEVLSTEYFAVFNDLLITMKKHKVPTLGKEVRISVNGNQVPLQLTLSILNDDKGVEIGKVLTFDDLTPVLRAQRAAAWTEVARRIAHEIKNPLTPIKLCAERLQKRYGEQIEDPDFKQNTKMIIDQVDSLKVLVNEFGNFARLPKANPVMASLPQVIKDALQLYIEAHRNCQFEFECDQNLPDFRFDPEQMKRVVTNLLDNAVSAVNGQLTKKIEIRVQYEPTLRIARIVVADTGAGIPAAMRERIFEPYVTTKDQGTGLGLAIVKRTVEDHHGFIRALPNVPKGTKIVIELPVVEANSSPNLVRGTEV